MSELVTIINRSSTPLESTWDGKRFILEPGIKYEMSRPKAEKCRDQHPVMGTYDKFTGEMQYLVAIIEDGNPTTPVEQSTARSLDNDIEAKIKSGELLIVRGNGAFQASDRASFVDRAVADVPGFERP